jgi:acyl-coenzyme A thioesterase PaaI-like protein
MSTKSSARTFGYALPDGATIPQRALNAPVMGDSIPSHFRSCFGCGDDHEIGLRMRLHVGKALTSDGTFTVSRHHQGAPGLAHGGLLSAAIDEVLGSLNWLLGEPAVTGRLECEFIKPVPVGSVLHIHAETVGTQRRKVFAVASARLNSESGPVAVQARAIFIQVSVEHFLKNGDRSIIEAAMPGASDFEVNP